MGVMVSSSHIVSPIIPSQEEESFPCSSMGTPKLFPTWSLPTVCSFPLQTAPEEIPSTGFSPSGRDCWFSPQGHKSCQHTCSSVGSSLHGATGLARVGFPPGHSLAWASPCSRMGLLYGLQLDLCIPINLHRLQGHSCFTMICTSGCREI